MPTSSSARLPYVSYRTFQTFLEVMREDMPARIERSVLTERFSGTSGGQIISSLRALQLIDDQGSVSSDLDRLARAVGPERRRVLQKVLRATYAPLFHLNLARATRAQFKEAFLAFGIPKNLQAKCESFFIQAAYDAGIELSRYILKGRHNMASRTPDPASPKPLPAAAHKSDQLRLAVAERIMSKYPDFDPTWSPEVQANWLKGMQKLYDSLGDAPSAEAPPDG